MSKTAEQAHRYTVYLTHDAYARLRSADAEWVGTEDYMGLAYFWNYEYRFHLRDATAKQRKQVHDALLAAGLGLDEESFRHQEIIGSVVGPIS